MHPRQHKRMVGHWCAIIFLFTPVSSTLGNSSQVYLECLQDFERYAETIWHDATGTNQPVNSGYWGDGGNSGNGGIRGACGVAVACATLVRALPDDPKNTERLTKITKTLNYAANTHVSSAKVCVNGRNWGWSSPSSSDWQTAEWSGSLGLACLLVQDKLPPQIVADCKRVVASEATHRAGIPPASGHVNDTKAEENAWDSNVLSLAPAWMSDDTNAPLWLEAAKKYLVNSYTVRNTNGDPLAKWISTVTLYPSYALENHGFYHPTYEMVAGMSLGDSLLMAQLANPAVAKELQPFAEHNVLNTWKHNLSAMILDSGEFAYPAGLDWELHDYEQNSYLTWMATHFNDPLARWANDKLAQLVRYRQIANGDGRFVGPSGGGFYREAVEARRTAIAWLFAKHATFPDGSATPPPPIVAHFPDVKIIVQRSLRGYVSLSYGSRIMAMIDAPVSGFPSNVFIATPMLPGVIGLGALGKPTSARLVNFSTNETGFEARLRIQNGANGSTEVYFKSTGETVAVVEVPHAAESATLISDGSFKTGIENDPLTGGSRLIEWNGGSTIFTNRSGLARDIASRWICVSGAYGIAAGPEGHFNYGTAASYNRSGAAEDTLQFIPEKPLSTRYAVWFPGKNANKTTALAARISWHVSETNAVLNFPGRDGTAEAITVESGIH